MKKNKIAILISGELRTFKKCISFNLNKFSNYEIYIIHGVWNYEFNEELTSFINKLKKDFNNIIDYKVILIKFNTNMFNEIDFVKRPEILKQLEPKNSKGNLPLFYSMNLVFNNLLSSNLINEFKYIVRLRPDIRLYTLNLKISEINKNEILVGHSKTIASDNFAIGGLNEMKIYFGIFKQLNNYWKLPINFNNYECVPVGERLMKIHLDKNHIKFYTPYNITFFIHKNFKIKEYLLIVYNYVLKIISR